MTATRISLLAGCIDKSVLVESLGYTCRGRTGATAPRVPVKYDARRALLVNGLFLGHLLFIGLGPVLAGRCGLTFSFGLLTTVCSRCLVWALVWVLI